MSYDPRCDGDADVVGVNLGDDAVEDHVEERRARGELEVLVRIPPEHERWREQRELSRVSCRRFRVAVRREERDGILHRRGVHLLEAEQEVAVPADEEFTGLQPDVPERDSRAHSINVEDNLRARHRAVAAVGSVRRRGHELRAPAHEHETIGIRNLRRPGHLVDDDHARKLKRDGDASKTDGRVPRVGDDHGDVHLASGGGPAGRGRVDRANANEIFGWKGGPRRDGELERAGGEVGAAASGRGVGGRLEKTSRDVVRRDGRGGGGVGSRSRSRGGRGDVSGIGPSRDASGGVARSVGGDDRPLARLRPGRLGERRFHERKTRRLADRLDGRRIAVGLERNRGVRARGVSWALRGIAGDDVIAIESLSLRGRKEWSKA